MKRRKKKYWVHRGTEAGEAGDGRVGGGSSGERRENKLPRIWADSQSYQRRSLVPPNLAKLTSYSWSSSSSTS